MHSDGGGPVGFVVLANSKLTGFTAVSYFFTLICEEPFLMHVLADQSLRMDTLSACRPLSASTTLNRTSWP